MSGGVRVRVQLLALAGIDAAIFGLAPGSIFPVDGLARMVVALGAISAGLGLFLDTLLLCLCPCPCGALAAFVATVLVRPLNTASSSISPPTGSRGAKISFAPSLCSPALSAWCAFS